MELPFGIDYAPQVVRDHGLREAHTYPLVSLRKDHPSGSMRVTPGRSQA